MGDLIEIVGRLREQGIQFRSLTEPFDSTDQGDELFFHIVAAFAQLQRRQISAKTRAGLAAAKARGRVGGQPTVVDPGRLASARQMRSAWKSFDDIAALLRVGASSVKRALRESLAATALRERLRGASDRSRRAVAPRLLRL